MIAVLALTTSTSASAGETSDSATFGPAAAPFTETAELAQCDPANGELLEVVISATADVTANYTLQSNSDVAQDATVDAQLALTLDGPGLTNPLVVDVAVMEVVAIDPAELIQDTATASDSNSVSITGDDLAPFIGTGTVVYSVDAAGVVTTSFSNGNGFGGGTNEVSAAVLTVTCVFEDAPANPSLSIEKSTNGEDADDAPGVELEPGDAVVWEYVVVNDGDVDLTNVVVNDDIIGQVCVIPSLAVGATEVCQADGVAQEGAYVNIGTATADPVDGVEVSDSDASNYTAVTPAMPGISLEKSTNGEDADDAPGVALVEGEAVVWEYVVTNTGNVDLTNVVITDDIIGDICVIASLPEGATDSCTAEGVAIEGPYMNLGSVSADAGDAGTVGDDDPSNYTARGLVPSIAIDKTTNGSDAPEGLVQGDIVTWTYVVTNDGETVLENVTVTDSIEGDIPCPQTTLQVGESMVCELTGTAVVGEYNNTGVASGNDPDDPDNPVNADDPSGYEAAAPVGTGTIGYWKSHASCSNNSGNQDGILDQTLPVTLWSGYTVDNCADAVSLLNKSPIDSNRKLAKDPITNMVAQYVGALLNYNNGTLRCPEFFDAIADAEALLAAIEFDGTQAEITDAQAAEANRLNELLDAYNNGGLCDGNFHRG